jgi:hypothetical protein
MAKASKSNELLYNVTLYNEGIQRLDGDVVSDSDGVIIFRYRRRGSSSYEQRAIAKSVIVGLSATTVLFRDRVATMRITKANVSPTKQSGKVEVTWSGTKGETQSMVIDAASADIVTAKDTKVAAPEGGSSKKKASKKKAK